MTNEPANMTNHSIFKDLDEGEIANRFDPKKVFSGIQKHLLAMAVIIFFFVGLGAYGTWYYTSNYQATAILIFQELGDQRNLPSTISVKPLSMSTALDLVVVPTHFQALKAILGLELSTKQLEQMISVSPPRANSQLIQIVAKSSNPNLAIDLANTLANIAVKSSREYIQKQLQSELDNYKSQLDQANQKLNQNRSEIEAFKTAHRYFEMTADYTTLTTQLIEAQQLLQSSVVTYNSLLVEYENLKRQVDLYSGSETGSKGLPKGPSLKRTRFEALQNALSEAKARYAAGNPKIKIIEAEIKALTGELESEGEETGTIVGTTNDLKDTLSLELIRLDAKVRAAQKTKEDLAAAVSKMEDAMSSLPADQVAFSKLLEQKVLLEEQVTTLTRSVETIKLMINVPKGGLDIYSTADIVKPLKESVLVNLLPLIGLFAGFGCALAVAFLIEVADTKLVTLRQVELNYNIAPIGLIPKLSGLNDENSVEKTLFYIRRIAERLERFIKVTPFSIAFCSARNEEGKSLISYHLARYYSTLGKKTIYIQTNPRPNMFSDKPPAKDLLDYLRGEIEWTALINHNEIDEIKVGGDDPHLKELLKSLKMKELFTNLKKDYEAIVVDAGGIIEDPYAVNLASLTDLNVFVINSIKTERKFIDESLVELAHSGHPPCGIILNQVPHIYIYDEKIKKHMKMESPSLLSWLQFWK